MRQILEKCRELNRNVCHLSVDFKQHMTLWRKEICGEMHKLGFQKNLLNFAEFCVMKCMLRLEFVNICPPNKVNKCLR